MHSQNKPGKNKKVIHQKLNKMKLVENLKWRYATKKFDSQKKVSQQDLDYLKEAVQLSVSSYGLQLYKVLIVEDASVRERLREVS